MKTRIIFCLVIMMVLVSCKKQFTSESEFFKWWNSKSNGLIREKIVNEFKITVRYVPMEYLLFRERDAWSGSGIHNKYKYSRTFLLTIEPIDKKKDTDLLLQDIGSYSEYKDRIIQLNFHPKEY